VNGMATLRSYSPCKSPVAPLGGGERGDYGRGERETFSGDQLSAAFPTFLTGGRFSELARRLSPAERRATLAPKAEPHVSGAKS
jgi:hypothetical protein